MNNEAPSISVVVPCYNAAAYIAATLDSVLAQEGPSFEIIAVDDGSTDGTAELIADAYPQVRLLQQANAGVAAARNAGIEMARGEWIAFVDADDIWLPGKLRGQYEALAARPACRMSYTAWHVWASVEPEPSATLLHELETSGDQWQGPSGWIYPDLLLDCVVWTSTVLAHRSLFVEAGNFDTSLRIGEDYDLWLRLSRLTEIIRIARPLALYRMHPANTTRRVPEANFRARVVEQALSRWGLTSPDGSLGNAAAVQASLAHSWSVFAGTQWQARDRHKARRAAFTALRHSPLHWPAWRVLAKTVLLK